MVRITLAYAVSFESNHIAPPYAISRTRRIALPANDATAMNALIACFQREAIPTTANAICRRAVAPSLARLGLLVTKKIKKICPPTEIPRARCYTHSHTPETTSEGRTRAHSGAQNP